MNMELTIMAVHAEMSIAELRALHQFLHDAKAPWTPEAKAEVLAIRQRMCRITDCPAEQSGMC